jgi:signal transduction histidine kinase
MNPAALRATVHGRLDREGRLVLADPPLLALHRRAGGVEGGVLAVPQIASLARLVRRLRIDVSRGVIAADGQSDLDLWVNARLDGDEVDIAITEWAERPAAAAGESVADVIGEPLTRIFSFVEGQDGSLPILGALAGQRRFDDQLARLRGGDGMVRLGGVPLVDGNGRFAGFRGFASRAPDAIAGTPAPPSEAFTEQLGRALKSPLDRIVADAETIRARSEGPLRSDYAGYAADIAVAGRHLLSLVDDLVDLQAIERPGFRIELEEIDLADVARRAAGLLRIRAADRDVRIDAPREDEKLPALGDFRRALQIMVNLIGNAVRYSPPGGMVWLRCEREADLAVVIVADQGKGIAPQDQARIFEKFERVDPSEPGGTGLGLYIARRLARAMRGDLAVDSTPGQGARFLFTLRAG